MDNNIEKWEMDYFRANLSDAESLRMMKKYYNDGFGNEGWEIIQIDIVNGIVFMKRKSK